MNTDTFIPCVKCVKNRATFETANCIIRLVFVLNSLPLFEISFSHCANT